MTLDERITFNINQWRSRLCTWHAYPRVLTNVPGNAGAGRLKNQTILQISLILGS
jgi:hypothetical protein